MILKSNSRAIRKTFLTAIALLCSVGNAVAENDPLVSAAKDLEKQLGARIGFAILDTETGTRWEHNASQRFPLTSTFKTMACASLLQKVDAGDLDIDDVIRFSDTDLVTYSPVTENFAGDEGMTLGDLCSATMTTSDNTAANLILKQIGGPVGLTQFLRSTGDETTRLDRFETELNEGLPGDERDTTTPGAMIATLQQLTFGNTLSSPSRALLRDWLTGNEVGDDLIRAGVPNDWVVGDRTGAGGYGSRANVAILWPPARKPIFAAIYITETEASLDERNAAIARIGRAIVNTIEGT